MSEQNRSDMSRLGKVLLHKCIPHEAYLTRHQCGDLSLFMTDPFCNKSQILKSIRESAGMSVRLTDVYRWIGMGFERLGTLERTHAVTHTERELFSCLISHP